MVSKEGLSDEEIREFHLKRIAEKSKRLVSTKAELSSPSEEQKVWFNEQMERRKLKKKNTPLVEEATKLLMQEFKFLTLEETEEIFYYDGGVYVSGAQKLIEKVAESRFGYKLNNANLNQIVGHIKRQTYCKLRELDADLNIINLKNGLYDIEKGKLLQHDPNYLSVNQKKVTYNELAKPKRFLKFLQEVLYPQEILTAIDAMAYTFHRDCPIETVFMLYGKGSNGKTVYTSVLTALHGAKNVSNVTFLEMLGDRFSLSDLEGKDLNIDNEITGQTIKEAAVLKRLTGGSRHEVRIQRKNQAAHDTKLYAKLFFNANRIPNSQDLSDAYNRRIVIISFPKRFEGKSEDRCLLSKLAREEEMSGIFNLLMRSLRRILKNKELFVNEKTIEEKRKKYERAVNPIKAFIEEAVLVDSSWFVPKIEFFQGYNKYCEKYTLPMENYETFCKILKKEYSYQDYKPTINDVRTSCWKNIILAPEYAPKKEQKRLVEMI